MPTLRDRVIQPEQYGTAPCSRCYSASPPPPMSPLQCLSGTQSVSPLGKREREVEGVMQQDTLTRCGRENHRGYGLPRPASFSFAVLSPPHLIFATTPYQFLSRPPLRSSHPLLWQMLLLSFTLFSCPPPVGDIVIFRHSWQCVAVFVCVSLGC